MNRLEYKLTTVTVSCVHDSAPTGKARNSRTACEIIRAFLLKVGADAGVEHFILLGIDANNFVSGIKIVHTGGKSSSIVDPCTVFRLALSMGFDGLIVAHTHPSGDPTPSEEDRAVTKRLVLGAALIGIRMLDSLILGDGTDNQFSFAESGLI